MFIKGEEVVLHILVILHLIVQKIVL